MNALDFETYTPQNPASWSTEFKRLVLMAKQSWKPKHCPMEVELVEFHIIDVRYQITWDWDENDELTIHNFIRCMEAGTPLPPVILVDDGVVDGFHRLTALDRLGKSVVPALNWRTYDEEEPQH